MDLLKKINEELEIPDDDISDEDQFGISEDNICEFLEICERGIIKELDRDIGRWFARDFGEQLDPIRELYDYIRQLPDEPSRGRRCKWRVDDPFLRLVASRLKHHLRPGGGFEPP